MRALVLAPLALFLLLGAGCGGSPESAPPEEEAAPVAAAAATGGWAEEGGNPARTRCTEDPGPVTAPGILWSALIDPGMATEPVVSQAGPRKVVVIGGLGSLWAIHADDGTEAWTAQLDGQITNAPTAVGDRLWIGSLDSFGVTLDPKTGEELGVYEGDFTFEAAALAVDGKLAFEETAHTGPARLSRLHVIDPVTLQPIWNHDYPGGDGCTPATDGERIFVHAVAGLVALNVGDGSIAWQHDRPARRQPSGVVVAAGRVIIQSLERPPSGYLTALDAATGAVLWDELLPMRLLGGFALTESALFAISGNGKLQRRDPATGALSWETALPGRSETGPVVGAGHVFVAGYGFVAAFDRETGEQVWTTPIDGEGAYISIDGESLLVATPNGFLHRLVAH